MLREKTVSTRDASDPQPFLRLCELLRALFPHLFAASVEEDFDGSLLLCWKGSGTAQPFLFMNHHDVVEAQDGWTHPPFSGEVFGGQLWGRGTLDTKGGLWAMLQAGEELAAAGFVPARDIYFESSCNEETTFEGASAIARALEERGIRFEMILDEGGMIVDEPIGGAKGRFAMIGLGERSCVDLLFTARGNGGHASAPETDTPLVRLGQFMAEADKQAVFPAEISPPIREMLRRLSPTVSGALGFVFAHPDFFAPILRRVMPRTSPTARALCQTTIAFTMASGSEGRNVIPAEASVVGNMRCSHHQGGEDSIRAIRELAAKYGIETTVLDGGCSSGISDYRSPVFARMEKAVEQHFPGVIPCPYIMTGASDARAFGTLSDNIYHFLPFTISEAQMESIHGIDENVDVSALAPAVDFYKTLMKE